MIGNNYWATGIVVSWKCNSRLYQAGFTLEMKFFDDGWAESNSTEGVLRTRYVVDDRTLAEAVRDLVADARRLGITRQDDLRLYAAGDGVWSSEYYPEDWREQIERAAELCGMRGYGAKVVANADQ